MPHTLKLVAEENREERKNNLALPNGSISGKWAAALPSAQSPHLWDEPLVAGIFGGG